MPGPGLTFGWGDPEPADLALVAGPPYDSDLTVVAAPPPHKYDPKPQDPTDGSNNRSVFRRPLQ